MQRQRGELVPVGEVFGGLGGLVPAIRETPPPARRGFTLADQVDRLVSASEADPDMGFMARNDGAVLLAAKQPRQPASVQARQRAIHALHERYGGSQAAFRSPSALAAGVDFDGGRAHSKPRVGF